MVENKKIKFFKAFFLTVVIGLGIFAFLGVHAQSGSGSEAAVLANSDVRVIIFKIIRATLGMLGVIALGLFFYGGYLYRMADGAEEKTVEAKKILVYSGVGFASILIAFLVIGYVLGKLVSAINSRGTNGGVEQTCSALGGSCGNSCADGEFKIHASDCSVCCVSAGAGGFINTNHLYITSLPSASAYCARNVNLAVVFNKPVDLDTISANASLVDAANKKVGGSWKYGYSQNIVIFTPTGACAPDEGNDCLVSGGSYTFVISNPTRIKPLQKNPEIVLDCSLNKGCGPVSFTAGSVVDRTAPSIKISAPSLNTNFAQGSTVPVTVSWTDDNGVQDLTLALQGSDGSSQLVDSEAFSQCQKNGSATLKWNTAAAAVGSFQLTAAGLDYGGGNGNDSVGIGLRPAHCFNLDLDIGLGEQQIGPPTCGGECGACPGAACSGNDQCASSECQSGKCLSSTQIKGFSPASGAAGTYVSIVGSNFGTVPGKIYFSKVSNPDSNSDGDWIEAGIPDCGENSHWTPDQVIAVVPAGAAASSYIKVITGPMDNGSGKPAPLVDNTANRNLGQFSANGTVRPNLCSLTPGIGAAGDTLRLMGKNFGQFSGGSDGVYFNNKKAMVLQTGNAVSGWSDGAIAAAVPGIDAGVVSVKVIKNNIESNGVQFSVAPTANPTDPQINSITPDSGPGGEYLTIVGKNFGTTMGQVWFKPGQNSNALIGDFKFPSQCRAFVWTDTRIIVKAPSSGVPDTSYYVQVSASDNRVSAFDTRLVYNFKSGKAGPGICSISPVSAGIPLASGQAVDIWGDNLNSGTSVYFWSDNATDPLKTDGRTPAMIQSNATANHLAVVPGVETKTGPVNVYRASDGQISNTVTFGSQSCVSANVSCGAGYKCCATGVQRGQCLSAGGACQGQNLLSGYVWRFSTKDIPVSPRVVERCDNAVNSGLALPSPSPSIQWNVGTQTDAAIVCNSALVNIEFSTAIDQKTVNAGTVKVNRCDSYANSNCSNPTPVDINASGYRLKVASGNNNDAHNYLSLKPDSPWEKEVWYQVVLTTGIRSLSDSLSLPLFSDRPCGDGTAYCFYFKGGGQACELRKVIVTPYSFTTDKLEAPIMVAADSENQKTPLLYNAAGLSSQNCTMMDVSSFLWNWASGDRNYAAIFGPASGLTASVSSKANTMAVGLPGDSVPIKAAATMPAGGTAEGLSPLTVNLANPSVVDWWPKCQEACLNAEVGVKFSVSLSNRNLIHAIENGTVQLKKCVDENCITTEQVGSSADVSLDPNPPFATISIASNGSSGNSLQPNTLYEVEISASSTDPDTAKNVIWSRSSLADPSSYSKPFNQQFSWRFKTKNTACVTDRVEVSPGSYVAASVNDRAVFSAIPYSSADSCSKDGQRLDPWGLSWFWSSSDAKVAAVSTFSTKGKNPFCSAQCVKRGSTIASTIIVPAGGVCGNGVVEAGEDCDRPDFNSGCGFDCRFIGNSASCGNGKVDAGEACDTADQKTQQGCSIDCRHQGSSSGFSSQGSGSTCGNGLLGNGEDCDLGIAADVSNSSSALGCSESCLHKGTALSTKWCFDHITDRGGFSTVEYTAACRNAISRCGDGETGPDEDKGCDLGNGKHAAFCDDNCLINKASNSKCKAGSEGCGRTGQYLGSSLLYDKPSSCGDGVTGSGEDPFCENYLIGGHIGSDPWSLVFGVGRGSTTGTPPAQTTSIVASPAGTGARGSGNFIIACGYKTDADCAAFGAGYGLAADSCCYARAKVTATMPADGSNDVCMNTAIEADFNVSINPATASNNVIIARGSLGDCASGEQNVSSLFASTDKLPWYKRALFAVVNFVKNAFGATALAAPPRPTVWCSGGISANTSVVKGGDGTSRVMIKLQKPLSSNTYYRVVILRGVKDQRGVGVGAVNGRDYYWQFSTANSVCDINSVKVTPDQWYFSNSGSSTTFIAEANSKKGPVQPIPGVYEWDFVWEPNDSPFVNVPEVSTAENVLTSKNQNGEQDVRAFANVTVNTLSSATGTVASGAAHIVVSLCENPWPPKEANGLKSFPFQDTVFNHSGYNLSSKIFDGTIIPPATDASGAPTMGDGYFNFSTYYCADNGSHGTYDDWPYLKVAVQSKAADLQVDKGTCEMTGDACSTNSECGMRFDGSPEFVVPQGATSVCGATVGGTNQYYIDSSQGSLACNAATDCKGSAYSAWVSGKKAAAACLPVKTSQLNCFKYSPLKRFIFTNDSNSDAIGLQILPNPRHLSPAAWYQLNPNRGGQGFSGQMQSVVVGGYQAVTDNNNIYIGGLNYTSNGRLYDVIYLFSINANASEGTRHVFLEMLKNLGLNNNILFNDGYCGPSITNPLYETRCVSDLDCAPGEVCSNQIVKLQRDVQRIRDMKVLDSLLGGYNYANSGKYPSLAEGTFLTGQAVSTWPSWTVLGTALQQAAPADPINKLGKSGTCAKNSNVFCLSDSDCPGDTCYLHDGPTGWGSSDLNFACNNKSYAYRYLADKNNFMLRVRQENPGLAINNMSDFLAGFGFSDLRRFPGISDWTDGPANSGICSQVNEVATLNPGTCGNKIVNQGEDCDPPGSIVCSLGGGKVCSDSCRWDLASASDCRSKCGNGILEQGESCDEGGSLNGTYGHCNASCSGRTGSCGDGTTQSPYELCDPGAAGRVKYGVSKQQSCNWDCKSWGLYCGDGLVQTEYGEQCEGDQNCTTGDGKPGIKNCNLSTCQLNSQCRAVTTQTATGSCGDGVVAFDEACDNSRNGVNNNGVRCTAPYGSSCTYCSADCKNIVTVNSTGYCGNQILEGSEVCDYGTANTSTPCTPGGTPRRGTACSYCTTDCNRRTVQPPTCQFDYTEWGPCRYDGTQTRSIIGSPHPSNCSGGTPFTTQSCVYTVRRAM